ncbi:MAG: cytochrome c family protein [Magnetococcales bacterium]|nr:cytochrome c family protein [Magnetococcales bacterium]
MKRNTMIALAIASAFGLASQQALAGDAAKGAELFKKKCTSCHSIEQGGKDKVGPNLHGIAGKASAKSETFAAKYSADMKASGLTWDDATLDKFLIKPKDLVKGTKMTFAGLTDQAERADVIAYMNTMK